MIKARRNFFVYHTLLYYSKYALKRHFKKINIVGDYNERNLPVLLVSNHISWWDGFWLMNLNLKVFKRNFYFMMLEEQLKKYWYFQYAGGFSIKNNSSTLLRSLDYATKLLSKNTNIVLIFPQGKINSIYNNQILFEKGIEYIIKNTKNPISIVQVVNLIDYLSHKKPTLNQYFREYDYASFNIKDFQNNYQEFYDACIAKQINL